MSRSAPRPPALVALLALGALAACAPRFEGPLRLLAVATADGSPARAGSFETGGETRPALLASARFRVPLPRRPLLTFGAGVAWAGSGEPPGWFELRVRAGGRLLYERRLNPRVLRGFRDVSLPLAGLGRETELAFELGLVDRDGRVLVTPPGLLLGIAEPVVHDLDGYGEQPVVVLVSIDTLRRDHVGAYGYARPTTPWLDTLARRGLLAQDAVSTSSWTLPAHLSLLTATDPSVHGGTDMKHGFNGRVATLPQALGAAGWATQAITSHLYVSEVYGLDAGFDHLDFRQDRKADEVADRAIAVLDRLGDQPLFLFLHLYDPHWHYDPPPAALAHFETGYAGTLTGLWQDFSKRDRDALSDADLQHLLALYDGEIRYTDDQLARVSAHLARRGLDRSALVVVTSDHGEEFLEHGAWEHQRTLYEEVIRIPLVVAGPRVPEGRVEQQASLLDVAPTILEWAGIASPLAAQGKSLLGVLPAREAYGETDHTVDGTRKLFLRAGAGRWKAILSLAAAGRTVAREEWYDLAADPGEQRDARPPDAVAEAIRARAVARWREGRGRGAPAPLVSLSEEQKERLRALGYVQN